MLRSLKAIFVLLVFAISLAYGLGSCRKDNPNHLEYLQQVIPQGFPDPVYKFEDNPVTKEGFELGRKFIL